VKQRYFDRIQKYNKGLLTPEEMLSEENKWE
jgi:hypothetical protein